MDHLKTNHIPIAVLGISHRTAGVEVRDKIALSEDEQLQLMNQIKQRTNVNGSLVLSTCNRTEIYLSGDELAEEIAVLKGTLTNLKSSPYFEDPEVAYELYDHDMAEHFFKVASGLDSQIVGEVQIMTQVKDAYNAAHETAATDAVLNKLFNFAMQAKKKVYNNTFLYDGTVSVSFAGVELARKIFSDLTNKKILLVGAGKTAELVAFHFMENGVKEIDVVNRTLSTAEELATQLGGRGFAMEQLEEALNDVDIVISATASETYVLSSDLLNKVSKLNKRRPMFLIDLAVPRDIDPKAEDIDNIYLFNLDDLQEIVNSNLEKRKEEIPKSQKILVEYLDEFQEWYGQQSMASVIGKLKTHLDQVRLNEIERLKKNLPQNGYAKEIDNLTESIINKVVRQHVKTLKKHANNSERYQQHIELINNLIEPDE
jgi:glutamyl-tRNA reductase